MFAPTSINRPTLDLLPKFRFIHSRVSGSLLQKVSARKRGISADKSIANGRGPLDCIGSV